MKNSGSRKVLMRMTVTISFASGLWDYLCIRSQKWMACYIDFVAWIDSFKISPLRFESFPFFGDEDIKVDFTLSYVSLETGATERRIFQVIFLDRFMSDTVIYILSCWLGSCRLVALT